MTDINNLITDNIDVWTSAIKKRNATGRGSSKKIELTGIKKLRKLILELAVRGKLVPQDNNDEPVNVLLDKITDERTQLILDKKIKKQKPLLAVTDEDKPFEIPTSWIFQRFGDVMFNRDGERKPVSSAERKGIQGEYDYYGASGVIDQVNGFLFDKSLLLIGEDGANLISRTTPIAFLAHGKYWVNNHAHVLDGITTEFLEFIALHINAISLEDYITGTAQPKMNQAKMNSIVVAIPPEAEQQRIVAKVDELMALCDQLEQQTEQSLSAHQTLVEMLLAALTESKDVNDFQASWQRIRDHFDVLFTTEYSIEQLKQTILQLAVMGKLVPQNPNDQPASVLLEKIAAEKAQLIADKKIKKQKPLPAITDEEKPFALSQGWEFERLGNCSVVFSGSSFKSGDFNSTSGVRVIKITNAGVGKLIETDEFLPESFLEKYQSFQVFKDDMILALTRPYISDGLKVSLCPDGYHESLLNQRVAAIRAFLHPEYLFLNLRSPYILNLYKNRFGGNGLQPNLKMSDVTELVIALPPLAEQHRIVAKVDELMALCEQFKARLSDAQNTQLHLADAVVKNALS